MEVFGEKNPDVLALKQQVIEIERRLGTPAERKNDLDRAQTLAHRLANLMFMALLVEGLVESGNVAGDCSLATVSPELAARWPPSASCDRSCYETGAD